MQGFRTIWGGHENNLIFLDGDILRNVFNNLDYSRAGRLNLGINYGKLCKMLADQGMNVVICTIAMFDAVREWNRINMGSSYKEIYLNPPIEELIRRDQKKLYSRALNHEIQDVLGINAEYEQPKNPDLTIDTSVTTPEKSLELIINTFGLSSESRADE